MNHTTVSTAAAADLSPLQAVIFDWAGTLVDFGSLAPTQIFVEAFASFGITITLAQARGPMGLSKWQHIHELLQDEGIRAHGTRPSASRLATPTWMPSTPASCPCRSPRSASSRHPSKARLNCWAGCARGA